MTQRDVTLLIDDILSAGRQIQSVVAGMTLESYESDRLVRSAVEVVEQLKLG